MDEKPDNAERRRWYQFGLRTLLIGVALLAVPCAYVGRQYQIVRERQSVRRFVVEHGGYFNNEEVATEPVPWIRRLLGDEAASYIELPDTNYFDRQIIREAFPEGKLIHMLDDDPKSRRAAGFQLQTELFPEDRYRGHDP